MNKYLAIGIVCFAVAACYILLTIGMPIITELASNAATEIPDTYTSTQDGLNYAPLIMYFIPGVVGIGFVVVILKKGN